MAERTFIDDLKFRYKYGGTHIRFVLVNVAIFLAVGIGSLLAYLLDERTSFSLFIVKNFYASSDPDWLLQKPWTILTYMFMHGGIFHILFNMVLLYFAGRIFEDLMGGKRLATVYILGGLFALLMHVFAFNVFPVYQSASHAPVVGASGSVMAIFIALAAYAPNMMVALFGIFRLKLQYLALFYVLVDLLQIQANDGVAHFAHLGGALFGWGFVFLMRKGTDLSFGFFRFLNFFKELFTFRKKDQPRMKVVKEKKRKGKKKAATSNKAHVTDNDGYLTQEEKQRQIDAILDKISKHGYESLSSEEKEILFKASNE